MMSWTIQHSYYTFGHNAIFVHEALSKYPPHAKQSLSKALVYTKSVLLPSMINLLLRESSNNALVLPTASSVRAALLVEPNRFRHSNAIVIAR